MENDIKNLVLEDEDGKQVQFEVITKLDIEDREYVIVTSEDSRESEEAIVLKIIEDEKGMEIFATVEDEHEFNQVSEVYEALF
ncbi:DUF1292 domain-containing protein [Clostridium luticellarii]|jgi:uncharacterized protein YrzB (UPF0473 family)|uniref:Uncharacterized protein n=1 Tax=Clostridium luticellarii TaxID=1691940 RepID=A0A2T0BRH5_9CLOT|nr:DUF1292 domain-containing protein [Clostridium luticellarii]MCI1943815.1 DUF1292 domain-containing protein [Clostridium luticellarii]MCI1967076.1 DUF1292 domain-containing protein [Clostridium luticellarii]MCI1994443.1 DUF1292 domain-containing protein [Clostridium luticellarii]MCI2038604.1 DUF1292 domain-containing protein [Clostridium luticellarii]PRR86478.1 hypothetical protein CLLU_05760 [Clostridium luticellarii]